MWNTEMKKIAFLMVLLFAGGLIPWQVRAQTGEVRYFPETGHSVSGAFLDFYNANPDALLLFGYPITDAFTDGEGREVQYFQRARFERQATPLGSSVTLTPLGQLMRERQKNLYPDEIQPAYVRTNPTACRNFPNGEQLCYDFLTFWENHQGEKYLGMPIAPIEKEGNRFVQYLEYARLEWRPEATPGQQIVVAPLGEIYFTLAGENTQLLRAAPVRLDDLPATRSLDVKAFVTRTSVSQHDEQKIYVIVRDQYHQPVENATVSMKIYYPDGTTSNFVAENNTNRYGFMVIVAPINANQRGLVEVEVNVTVLQNITGSTRTSFRIWY